MVSAVSRGGKKHFFVERSPAQEYIFDPAMSNEDYHASCSDALANSWIIDENSMQHYCEVLRKSIEGTDVQFYAVDQRHRNNKSPFEQGDVVDVVLGLPVVASLSVQEFLTGHRSIGSLTVIATMMPSLWLGDELKNDQPTVVEMLDVAPNGGVVLFGAGYYKKNNNWSFKPQDMKRLLEAQGYSVCVVNIHKHEPLRLSRIYRNYNSDADLIVFPSAQSPSGVIVHNSSLGVDRDNDYDAFTVD